MSSVTVVQLVMFARCTLLNLSSVSVLSTRLAALCESLKCGSERFCVLLNLSPTVACFPVHNMLVALNLDLCLWLQANVQAGCRKKANHAGTLIVTCQRACYDPWLVQNMLAHWAKSKGSKQTKPRFSRNPQHN